MACEILIKALDGEWNAQMVEGSGWQVGHPVCVMPFPTRWGKEEDPNTSTRPDFWIITVMDADADQLIKDGIKSSAYSPDGTHHLYKQRQWKLDINSLPKHLKRQLLSTGRITVNLAQLSPHIKHHENKKGWQCR